MSDAGASPGSVGGDADRRWLARALGLATAGAATCRPNPPVGCVLVRDGTLVGEGWHVRAGGPHAEVVALRAAGRAAEGATAYVSLEPCDHTGRTGPCSRALLDAGVARVVHASADPDPDAAGGAERLRAAGVPCELLPLDGFEQAVPSAFLHQRSSGLAHVTAKLALTADGDVVAPRGRWITGPVARRRVHRLRARADAVLVGVGTVLADDPRLDVRHAPLLAGQPRPVVLDPRLRTPPGAAVVARGALLVAAGRPVDTEDAIAAEHAADAEDAVAPEHAEHAWDEGGVAAARAGALEAAGAQVLVLPAGRDGRPELDAVLRALAERDLQVVLAEPGPTLATALLSAGLLARQLLHVPAATPAAARRAASRAGLPLDGLALRGVARLGDDLELDLRPRHD